MKKLNAKQLRFVEEYLIDLNATQAAIRAGYSEKTAKDIGCQNLAKLNIQAEIQERMKKRSARTEITADRVLQEYARIAFLDPRRLLKDDGSPRDLTELDDDTAAGLSGVDLQDVYEGFGDERQFVGYTKKYRFAPKIQALEMLARHTGVIGKIDEEIKRAHLERLRRENGWSEDDDAVPAPDYVLKPDEDAPSNPIL